MDYQELFEVGIKLFITILSGVCTMYLVPWLKSKYNQSERKMLLEKIDLFVMGAQQIAKAMGYDSEWKKQHVIDVLEGLDIVVTAEINDYIEASVYALKQEVISIDGLNADEKTE